MGILRVSGNARITGEDKGRARGVRGLRRTQPRDSEIALGDLEQKEVNSSSLLYPQQIKLRGFQ